MKKNRKQDWDNVLKINKIFRECRLEMIFLIVVSILALLCSFWNTAGIRKSSEENTERFLNEITAHRAEMITNEINYKISKLENIGDSLEQYNIAAGGERVSEFLKRKTSLSEFDSMVIIDTEKNDIAEYGDISAAGQSMEELMQISAIDKAFQGENGVDCIDGKMMVYTIPVYVDEKIGYVLCGFSSRESMVSSAKSEPNLKNSITCIVNSDDKVIVSLQESEDFEKEEEVFVSHDSLKINDWSLMTMIPADLFTGISKGYVIRMNLIIVITSLIFFAFLHIIYKTYDAGREELIEKVFFDDVTGGLNGRAFRMKYRQIMSEIQPFTYTIVLLDAKNFKLVNEKFGEEQGDQFLYDSYQMIQKHIHEEDNEFATRSELDHFFICMKEERQELVQKRIDNIIHDINEVWRSTGTDHPMTFRQSAYTIEDNKVDIRVVKDRVRVALQKQHQSTGERCVFYDQKIMETIKRNHKLENLFESSIENHDFEMYLQPKIEVGSWKLRGAEALVRWNHPEEGMIFPSEFIPLFEMDGKIQELDRYMFEETCKFIMERQRAGKALFPISVNIARNHFQTLDFLDKFVAIADKYNVPRNLLEFELTERIFVDEHSIENIKEGMHRIHEMGFLCSIDDFGAGYSSLGLLREFEIDVLKLDRSFFMDMSDKKSRNIIKCLIELAKNMNVQTVAEGIETKEQMIELRDLPCNLIQGYIFSKPLSVSEFEKWEGEFVQTVEGWLQSGQKA